MEITDIEIWMIIGFSLLLLDFAIIPAIGFLFLGLGALSTAMIIYYFPEMAFFQIASFGLSSLIWFLLLWLPLKRFVYGKKRVKQKDYFDMVGMRVKVVSDEIISNGLGKVSWSGTTMNAKFIDSGVAKRDEYLYITEIQGNVVICSREEVR